MRKKICLLAALALLAANILPISNTFAGQPPSPDYAQLIINGALALTEVSNATSTTANFSDGTLTISGTGLYSSGTTVHVPAASDVTLTASGAGGLSGKFVINGANVNSSTHTLQNLAANSVTNIDTIFAPSSTSATINYTYDGVGAVNSILIGDAPFDIEHATPGASNTETAGTFTGTIEYLSSGANVTFAIEPLFINRLTALTVNNVDCTAAANFPNTPAKILEATGEQVIHYTCEVPFATTYNIATTTAENHDEWMTVGNFLWSYLDQDKGTDDYVGNGRLNLVKVKYGGVEYSEAELANLNKGYLHWGEFSGGLEGGALLPAGAEVTVELIPEAGYQLTSFTINGGAFEPQTTVGTYTFEIPKGNFHLGAHFTAVDDSVAANADVVESGSIILSDGEIDAGTARLDVDNVELGEEDTAKFEDAAGEYEVKTYLDISLYQTIYKGTAADTWDEQIRELDNEATITLKLDESVDGNDIVIVHQKHDGTYEVIPTTYDPVAHTITFKTSSFSNYAIATRTIASPDTGVMPAEGASATINTEITLSILGVITLCGLAIYAAKNLAKLC